LPDWTEARHRNAYCYNKYLADSGLITPVEIDDVTAVYHLYVVRVKKESRQKFQAHLQSKGISTGIHYPIALPNLKAYAYLKHSGKDFPEATKISQEIVSLPMFPELDELKIKYIAAEIKTFFREIQIQ
jgi:dTDP-4-amino-4,6-dideoxygalactose transaminase